MKVRGSGGVAARRRCDPPVIWALAAAIVFTACACGRGEPPSSRRVIASPSGGFDASDIVTPTPSASPSHSTAKISRTPRPVPPSTSDLSKVRVRLKKIATLDAPLAMAIRASDSAFYIAEKNGRIKAIRGGKVASDDVLDISTEVSNGGEQGLLGLAFDPDGDKLYVNFTNTLGDTVVREYGFSGGRADTGTARDVLTVDQPYANHNGGNLMFGPDNYLYIGMGDGGSGGDPDDNAQNLDSLLGKMLRIDPAPLAVNAYQIPPDNPFVGQAGLDEIWAYGLRNPWRYSFDSATGDLWTGDVGQNAWEEVDYQPGASAGGENYGWALREGSHRFKGAAPSGHAGPIYEYANADGNCAVTGGYVYRGEKIGNLAGAYVFADFCVGRLRAFLPDDGRALDHRFLGPRAENLASFGEDQRGELYVLSLSGPVYRIDPV